MLFQIVWPWPPRGRIKTSRAIIKSWVHSCSAGAGLTAAATAVRRSSFRRDRVGCFAGVDCRLRIVAFVAVLVAGFAVTFRNGFEDFVSRFGRNRNAPVRAEKAAALASGMPIHSPAQVATAVLAARRQHGTAPSPASIDVSAHGHIAIGHAWHGVVHRCPAIDHRFRTPGPHIHPSIEHDASFLIAVA
jgi:hypothetical protein